MYIQNKPRWQIKENQVTNEQLYLNRRKFIKNSFSILGSTALLHNFLKNLNATQKNEYFLKFKINKNTTYFQISLQKISVPSTIIFLSLDLLKIFGKKLKN